MIGQCKFRQFSSKKIKPISISELRDFEATLQAESQLDNQDNNPIGIFASNIYLSRVAQTKLISHVSLPLIFFQFNCNEDILSLMERTDIQSCDNIIENSLLIDQFRINSLAKSLLRNNCDLELSLVTQLLESKPARNKIVLSTIS